MYIYIIMKLAFYIHNFLNYIKISKNIKKYIYGCIKYEI